MMLKRFDEAIQPMKEGLRRNEDVPYGLNALGYAYIHLGMNEEARAALQLAMKYDPQNAAGQNWNIDDQRICSACMYIYIYTYVYTGVYAYIHMCIHMYTYIYIYIHLHCTLHAYSYALFAIYHMEVQILHDGSHIFNVPFFKGAGDVTRHIWRTTWALPNYSSAS